jgi:hypothetical protein
MKKYFKNGKILLDIFMNMYYNLEERTLNNIKEIGHEVENIDV